MDQANADRMRRGSLKRNVFARMHLLICIAIGFAAIMVQPASWHMTTRLLIGWNVGIWIYIGWAALTFSRANVASIRDRAEKADESRFVVLTVAILAATASLVAIVAQLGMVKQLDGELKALHLGLAILTIFSSWTFIHLMFAQHYAHEFFVERKSERKLPADQRGGLDIPGCDQPEFGDFLYFSFVIGVACATADIDITSKTMRRVAMIHCVLSFFFNTTILALTINIGAGLI